MTASNANTDRERLIRSLFDEYIEMYAGRDNRLTTRFSDNFSGYTGGGDFLVNDRQTWEKITLQDFAQVSGRIRIEMLDLSLQDLSPDVVVATAFFHIHLPIPDHVLSAEVARLVLIFRLEGSDWKIVHSGISIPYHLVQEGEIYPMRGLREKNKALEAQVAERTQALRDSESMYRLLAEDTQDVLWKTDRHFRITYISPADEYLRGFKADDVVGHSVFEMFTDEGVAIVNSIIDESRDSVQSGTSVGYLTFEVPHRCKDGRVLWGEVVSKRELNAQGEIVGYHGITREITKRKLLEDQVRQLAFYDTLTNLPNRRLLNDRLTQSIAANKRSNSYGALIFLDLDNFKQLNDKHGHVAGDLLLIEAAARLKGCVREMDTVARFGGDEFVVILNELDADKTAAISRAQLVAEKILASLSAPYLLTVGRDVRTASTVEHHCTASIGVVTFVNHECSQDDILKWADGVMYQAKNSGGNSIQFYVAET
ncbi:cyclic di-GMP phosphodiesterase Gmr [mine drainage metagenome]|uniref:Cyclic di-GMP phosphodiesterase Gmr n=1 Tax=mine drainage metagenome TaxID=410659 RepID=A0A1J5TGF1_9ZZZZ